ncbi:hypothetical protein HN51_019030 [Arachis hypogaea]
MTKLETLFLLPSVLSHYCHCSALPPFCQDSEKGKGWKRFEFDKDAPLEDEEIEVLFLVNIHASSMYGRLNIDRIHFLIKARREEQIQAAHDKAMFGASALPPPTSTDSEPERENEKEVDKKAVVTSLLSETMMIAELRLILLINLLLKSFSLT